VSLEVGNYPSPFPSPTYPKTSLSLFRAILSPIEPHYTHPGRNERFDVAIAIGVLIKGETMHFEYIAEAVSNGLMRVSLDTGLPVIFGVLTVLTQEQAMERAGLVPGKTHNHGVDWGHAAVEMAIKIHVWTGRTEPS
jgi:6,7-dimethyl-8-ribityllumazine synthase